MRERPLYPFGFGLSYNDFEYGEAKIESADESAVTVSVNVKNKGRFDCCEKVQVYAHYEDSRTETPALQLCGVKSVPVGPGETVTVSIEIDRYWLSAVLENGERVAPDGETVLYIGGRQPGYGEETCSLKL